MSFSLLSLILMLLGSGGGMNSLLDLTDPEAYLKAQGIEYRLEALIGVLEEPAAKDVDVVTSQQVRKLQAMRGLGELKDKAALPVLEKVSKQREMFFDDYALAAMAKIRSRKRISGSPP